MYFWQGPMNFTFCFRQSCPDVKSAISAMYFSINSSAKNIATIVRRRLVRAKFSLPSVSGEESKRLFGPHSSVQNKEPEHCYTKDISEKDKYETKMQLAPETMATGGCISKEQGIQDQGLRLKYIHLFSLNSL